MVLANEGTPAASTWTEKTATQTESLEKKKQ